LDELSNVLANGGFTGEFKGVPLHSISKAIDVTNIHNRYRQLIVADSRERTAVYRLDQFLLLCPAVKTYNMRQRDTAELRLLT
jgi:hypothetical protein